MPDDVNEITNNHTKAVSGEILRGFFVLAKIDFEGLRDILLADG